MASIHSDEFKQDVVLIAQTSGLSRRQLCPSPDGHHQGIHHW